MSDATHGGYSFALLDPRGGPQAQATNDRVFASSPVYGVEVTVPALAERCVENFDRSTRVPTSRPQPSRWR